MYSNHPPVLLPFGQQKKGFIYPEEYFKEIEDSDYWLTKLFKLMARLLGNTYSGSGQEVFQGIADLFFVRYVLTQGVPTLQLKIHYLD